MTTNRENRDCVMGRPLVPSAFDLFMKTQVRKTTVRDLGELQEQGLGCSVNLCCKMFLGDF